MNLKKSNERYSNSEEKKDRTHQHRENIIYTIEYGNRIWKPKRKLMIGREQVAALTEAIDSNKLIEN